MTSKSKIPHSDDGNNIALMPGKSLTKAIGYTRVSTEEQAMFGASLASQKEKIEQYAKLYNIENVEIIEDAGISAKNLKRPGIQRILSMMKHKEIETVIVTKLDRLTRSVRDLTEIVELANKKGIALVSVQEQIDTGTAAGRIQATDTKEADAKTIVIEQELYDVLLAIQIEGNCKPDDFIFLSIKGGKINQNFLERRFRRYADAAGFTGLVCHDFRHEFTK